MYERILSIKHCLKYKINHDYLESRIIRKNTQIFNFLIENAELFVKILNIINQTPPKWFMKLESEQKYIALIITKIIVCAFLDGSHNIMDKEKHSKYIDMYLVLSDILKTIVEAVRSLIKSIDDRILLEREIKQWIFKIIEIGTIANIFVDKIIWIKKKSIKLKRINSSYSHFIVHMNIEYHEKAYTKIIIDGVPYLTTCYYLDKICMIKPNEMSNTQTIYNNEKIKFIEDASSVEYLVDAERVETILKILKIKNQYEEYCANNKYYEATAEMELGNNKAISNYYRNLLLLYVDKNLKNKKIFFPHFCDFRWRIYNASSIGLTTSKIFRYIYTYGYYSYTEINEINNNLSKSASHKLVLMLLPHSYRKNIENPMLLDALFWLFIELGKINKTELIKNGYVECCDLLDEGYKIYNGKTDIWDLEDTVVVCSIIKIINEIYEKNTISKKYIIFKDSTASVLQLMSKLLGWKEPNILEIMNINSIKNRWHDPYTYIINKYIETIDIDDNRALMTRKNLKKIIMTVQYSVSKDSALKYYAESKNSNILEIDKKEKENILTFMKYLTDIVEQEFLFLKNSSELTKGWNNKMILYTSDNVCFSLNYNKKTKKQIQIIVDNKRKSIIDYQITNTYDKRKTKQALRANIIHIMDAYIARSIISKWKIGTIHDSFGIDILKTSLIIDSANELFNEHIFSHNSSYIDKNPDKKTYSLFIIL